MKSDPAKELEARVAAIERESYERQKDLRPADVSIEEFDRIYKWINDAVDRGEEFVRKNYPEFM